MDAKMIENIGANYKSAEITKLTTRWSEIVKPGIYRMTGGRWERYHEPKIFRNERKVIEERLQQLTNNWPQEDLRQKLGLSSADRSFRTMDSGSILGDGPANRSSTTPI